ncbi:MAG: class I SAM-dependent methyltransferase [Vicinamibacterales bacterium]
MPDARHRGEYGYDAPYALIAFAGIAVATAAAAVAARIGHYPGLIRIAAGYAAFFGCNAASFYYTTRHGKFQEWEQILDCLSLRGDEQVLDMGCGRGAVLTAVAKRLTTGRATGIDLWRSIDQSGNAPEATMANATAEGVADLIGLETSDMRKLPFADASFDVIVSSLAIHNIRGRAGRAAAVREAMRVLRPGGRIAIADVRTTRLYADTLASLGAKNIQRRRLGWRFWWGNPIAATALVTATKSPL